MSERGRGGSSRGRGGSDRGGRGGGSGQQGRESGRDGGGERKREAILDLSKYANKRIRVKFSGGREVEGILKGWDQLLNLVLDDTQELMRDPETLLPLQPAQRRLIGLSVVRGTSLVVINPVEGFGEIANPFLQAEEA
ncbi:MAG: Sm-like protein lsm7 [Cyphobasidiales sp. Tagirdzhanova-0007]|nr:MAG: Sm-like protein lsm7 [Cyphobasidiales sp. Tagirdzhanova-0007]